MDVQLSQSDTVCNPSKIKPGYGRLDTSSKNKNIVSLLNMQC